jgi:hypothetical protein
MLAEGLPVGGEVGGGVRRSVVRGAGTCFFGSVVDDGTVVDGAATVGGVRRMGCAPFCTGGIEGLA